MRRLALALLVPVLLSCARAGGSADGSSGVEGRVVAFPPCPVAVETSPCPEETVATMVVVESGSGPLKRVVTDADGSFRIALEPGRYVVRALPPLGSDLIPRPQRVTVNAGRYQQVTVVLDTRLREP